MEIHPYILGILWGIGYYEPTAKVFILRHKDRYFLDAVKAAVNSDAAVREQSNQGKYILKLGQYCFDVNELQAMGWTARNSQERAYPNTNEHQDFIRGYFEVHGRISTVRLTNRKTGRVQKQTRLRLYGNETLLRAVNEIISFELDIPEKRMEGTPKEHSKVLAYYRLPEIVDILDWMYTGAEQKNADLEAQYYSTIERSETD